MASIMNLPNEMLLMILENMDQESIEKTSRVNRRLESIVKRYKLYKPVAKEIKITRITSYERDVKFITLTIKMSLLKYNEESDWSCYIRNYTMKFSAKDSYEKVEDQMVEIWNKITGSKLVKLDLPIVGIGIPLNVLKSAFKKASIDLSFITCIDTCQKLEFQEVDDEHLVRIMKSNPARIQFNNCATSISINTMVLQIQKVLEEKRPVNYNFGSFEITDPFVFGELILSLQVNVEVTIGGSDFVYKIKRQLPTTEGFPAINQEIAFTVKMNMLL